MKGKQKYILNVKTGMLHILNNCYHSQHITTEIKMYNTEDEAITENQNYIRYCRKCFKGR